MTNKEPTIRDKREHLWELVKDFDTVILVTRGSNGMLHGRPMTIAELTDDGVLYFSTSMSSPKALELAADGHAGVYIQGKTKWVSLSGKAEIVNDRVRVHRLWAEDWRIWFPGGKDDPDLGLVRFDPTEGEYWDNSGGHGVRFAIEAAKAYLQGRAPDERGIDQNAKVNL